jgi:protein-tyrosine phosphatase
VTELEAPLSVVFICTGNRFRSPLAESLFRRAAGDVPVRAISRATLDLPPLGALPEAVEEAARLGVDLTGHRSRSVVGEDLSSFELVVGFERHHLATAVVAAGADRARVFTLPQLVSILETLPAPVPPQGLVRARELLSAAAAASRWDVPLPELGDPLGRPRRVQRQTAEQIEALVSRLAHRLFRN